MNPIMKDFKSCSSAESVFSCDSWGISHAVINVRRILSSCFHNPISAKTELDSKQEYKRVYEFFCN